MEHIRINDKIRLERVKASMAPVIFQIIDRDREYLKEWLPFVNFTKKVGDTELFIESISSPENVRDEIFSIWYNEEFAGLVGFKDTDWTNKKTEIGYWLAQPMQGKGIIYACVQKLLSYAFQKLKLNRVQIKVAEGNQKSEAIPQKLNFTFEGIERAGELHGKDYLNLKIFSRLAADSV